MILSGCYGKTNGEGIGLENVFVNDLKKIRLGWVLNKIWISQDIGQIGSGLGMILEYDLIFLIVKTLKSAYDFIKLKLGK